MFDGRGFRDAFIAMFILGGFVGVVLWHGLTWVYSTVGLGWTVAAVLLIYYIFGAFFDRD